MRKKSLSAKKRNYKIIADNLSDKRINNIFKLFENNLKKKIDVKKYGAAISGGPDSMALAYLIYRYNLANKKKCFYYHVDHQLRKNSFEEAQKVKHVLKKWNINLKVIRWLGKKPEIQIQSIARLNRYNLLKKEMKKANIKYLFLGHVLETYKKLKYFIDRIFYKNLFILIFLIFFLMLLEIFSLELIEVQG